MNNTQTSRIYSDQVIAEIPAMRRCDGICSNWGTCKVKQTRKRPGHPGFDLDAPVDPLDNVKRRETTNLQYSSSPHTSSIRILLEAASYASTLHSPRFTAHLDATSKQHLQSLCICCRSMPDFRPWLPSPIPTYLPILPGLCIRIVELPNCLWGDHVVPAAGSSSLE